MRVVVTSALMACLSIVPMAPSHAATPSPHVEPLPADAALDARVQKLYELGATRYEAGEYDEALIAWKRTFVQSRPPEKHRKTRAALVINILAAHRAAHEVSHNPEHLAEAIRVIDLRNDELVQFHSRDHFAFKEMERLNATRAELEDLHATSLREGEVAQPLADGVAFQIEPAPAPKLNRARRDMLVGTDHELGADYRKAKVLVDVGIIVLPIGFGAVVNGSILMIAQYKPRGDRGDSYANPVPPAIALGAIAVAAAITGGTLIGVGTKRKKQIRANYRPHTPTGMLVPLPLRSGGGLGLVGRF